MILLSLHSWVQSHGKAVLVLFLLFLLKIGSNSEESTHHVVEWIHYSGALRGEIEPCGCKIPVGGIARRIGESKHAKELFPEHLHYLVDAGGWRDLEVKPGKIDRTPFLISAMTEGSYVAVNVTARDLFDGIDVITNVPMKKSNSFVSFNLRFHSLPIKGIDSYRIVKNIKGSEEYRIAFIGTTDPKQLTKHQREQGLEAVDWKGLDSLTMALRKSGVNTIVLLTDAPSDRLHELLPNRVNLDLIVSSSANWTYQTVQMVDSIPVVCAYPQDKMWESVCRERIGKEWRYSFRELGPRVVSAPEIDSLLLPAKKHQPNK